MIDFHTHIIPGIDDGSQDVQMTVDLLKEAEKAGFQKIILTSHYLENEYVVKQNERIQLLEAIKKLSENLNINVELYLGSEIFVDMNIVDFLKQKKASTINGSRYVLFELPLEKEFLYVREVIYKLLENGYKPIIAHPERYQYVQDDFNYVNELANMGVLFQSNYASIIGWYGVGAKKTVKKLLENDLVHFLGSDVHRDQTIYPQMYKCINEIRKIIPVNKFQEISEKNIQKVLDNEQIII